MYLFYNRITVFRPDWYCKRVQRRVICVWKRKYDDWMNINLAGRSVLKQKSFCLNVLKLYKLYGCGQLYFYFIRRNKYTQTMFLFVVCLSHWSILIRSINGILLRLWLIITWNDVALIIQIRIKCANYPEKFTEDEQNISIIFKL